MERTALALCSLLALVTYSCSQNVPQCVTQPLSGDKIVCNGVDLSLLTAQDISSAYSGSGSKISSVELVNCDVPPSLTFLNTTVLNSLKSLTLDGVSNAHTIIISSFISFISSLEELKLLNMPALTSIDFIKDTDIVRVPWGSMKRLQVNNCGVTEIDPAVWERLSILEYLSLRENHIRNLDFRDTNPFLTELDASNNHIMEILSFKWDTFTMLQKFNMSYNELSDPNILNKIYDTVVDIDLSYNQFTQLTLTASRNSELEFLSLSHNQLTTITPSFFESRRTKLKNLNLSYNKGLELSPLSFANLVYLERLDLHFCRLNSITTEFQNLISLQMLNLSGNALIDLPVDTFKGTDELRYLDLHGNRLSSLSCFSSQSASILLQLQIMDLSGNDLRSLPNLTSLYNLKLLSIRDNRLDKLDNCQHIDSLTRLSQLCMPILSLSPHRCKLQAFVQTMKTNSATNRLAYNNEACCSNPAHTNLDCCVDSPSHPVCQSGSPLNYSSECPSVEELCDPQTTTPTVITGQPSVLEPRENFTDLYASEIAAIVIGYLLALILLVVIVWFILRQNFLYKKWSKNFLVNDLSNSGQRESGISYNAMTESISQSPQRSSFLRTTQQRLDSVDSLGSSSLGSVTYSDPSPLDVKGSPIQFGGRKKFEAKKSPKVIPPPLPAANNYTVNTLPRSALVNSITGEFPLANSISGNKSPQFTKSNNGTGTRPKLRVPSTSFCDSPVLRSRSAHSPTSMSVYSYASVQSEQLQQGQESGSIPWASSARFKSASTSKLLTPSELSVFSESFSNQPIKFLNTSKLPKSKMNTGRIQRVRRSSGDPASAAARRRYLRSNRSPLARQKSRVNNPVTK